MAIEARQARHGYHPPSFVRLSTLAEQGDIEKEEYLCLNRQNL